LGRLDAAVELLSSRGEGAPAPVQLLLGEILLEMGQRDAAEAALMTIIEAYNDDRIKDDDGPLMAVVGRAAQLLRSPEDANDAFNKAELAGAEDDQTLLWRIELFLDNYDIGHAEEVTREILARSPNHPDALVWMARVHLEQALDFDAAEELTGKALKINPKHLRAHFVRAGVALRDMGLQEAVAHAQRGLQTNPRDLELLSILATAHFLADDEPAFEKVKAQVFSLNPHYSRFYQIVGKYADWEHRYEEIVEMMRQAIAIDDEDAKAHAQLGINLIRNGDDRGGLASLRRAFAKDPYNVRVYNTLELYEKTIAKEYVDVSADPFRLRYSNVERPVLERFVPELMTQAWNKFRGYYEFTPSTPIGVELYAERPNFAIRTSGLPRTAIQGVCFGKTLASMTPRHEEFNLGMTLWHELAHVFHIQLSRSRVPRWFTEGLAEYETLIERPEWRREQDQRLYLALREQRLPKLGQMNEAFTHAEDISDVAVAYYASTQIVAMLAERYGRSALRKMLVGWGEGKRTEEVLKAVIGRSSAELDAEFRGFLDKRLSGYKGQYVPSQRIGNPEAVMETAKAHPEDADAQVKLALLMMRTGDGDQAELLLKEVLDSNPNHVDTLWLSAKVAIARNKPKVAAKHVAKLLKLGQDGYEVRILQARAASATDDRKTTLEALRRAHQFEPKQAEALHGLLDLVRDDAAERLALLRKLAEIEEHDGSVFRRLSAALIASGQVAEAVKAAESGVYAAMEDPEAHISHAEALAAAGRHREAERAYESALLCPVEGPPKAHAHLQYARYLASRGRKGAAKEQLEIAKRLDPKLAGVKL
jgi:tetratricopeptide (TPR) repeat protein